MPTFSCYEEEYLDRFKALTLLKTEQCEEIIEVAGFVDDRMIFGGQVRIDGWNGQVAGKMSGKIIND